MENLHTAEIKKSTPEQEKYIRGTFEVIDGELSFNCSNQNATFDEVLVAITKLRDECQRQIENQNKCPFKPKN